MAGLIETYRRTLELTEIEERVAELARVTGGCSASAQERAWEAHPEQLGLPPPWPCTIGGPTAAHVLCG